mgnify:CR=1 FL=1
MYKINFESQNNCTFTFHCIECNIIVGLAFKSVGLISPEKRFWFPLEKEKKLYK